MRNIFKYIGSYLRARTITELIECRLKEAQMEELKAESAVDYAKFVLQYHQQRIERLKKRLREQRGRR